VTLLHVERRLPRTGSEISAPTMCGGFFVRETIAVRYN